MSRNAPKCILGAVVVAVFFALTWSTTAARLSITTAGSAVKPTTTALAPLPIKLRSYRASALTATVTTDKVDYQPGDTVVITGTGWQAGETVALTIVESD